MQGLNDAGVVADDFYLSLDGVILSLIGFKEEDFEAGYKIYDEKMEHLKTLTVSGFTDTLNSLAQDIYIELLAEKKYIERIKQA